MINVNQITAQLARMPDQALQQYAAMHKNDPYTVSLALSESNRRKQMRSAAQGQSGMGMQPPVVDQDIAKMVEAQQRPAQTMPEDVGIGTLPAPNMQGMAMGGIVAFGDGGEVPGYADGGAPPIRSYTGGKDYFLDIPDTIRDPDVPYYRQIPNPLAPLAGKKFNSRDEAIQAYNAMLPPAVSATYPDESQRSVAKSAPVPTPAPAPDIAPAPRVEGIASIGRGPSRGAEANVTSDMLAQYQSGRSKLSDVDPYADDSRKLGEQGIANAQERQAALAVDQAKFADAYKEREGRLTKREGELTQQKESNTGLAFLNAGLAIMSTPGGLATAIGKGAQVGTQQFAAGLDKIRAAQERLDEARDKTEELKLNRAELSAQQIRQADAEINTAKLDAKKLTLSGLKDAGAKNDKVAGLVFEATAKQAANALDNATKLQVAGIMSSAASGNAAARHDNAANRLQLDTLRAQQTLLQKQLTANPPYGKTKAENIRLNGALANIEKQLAGGTMATPSAATTPGGTIYNFDAQGNLVK